MLRTLYLIRPLALLAEATETPNAAAPDMRAALDAYLQSAEGQAQLDQAVRARQRASEAAKEAGIMSPAERRRCGAIDEVMSKAVADPTAFNQLEALRLAESLEEIAPCRARKAVFSTTGRNEWQRDRGGYPIVSYGDKTVALNPYDPFWMVAPADRKHVQRARLG